VGEGHPHAWAHFPRGAAADGIDYEQGGSWLGERCVDFFGGSCFLDARAGEFFAWG